MKTKTKKPVTTNTVRKVFLGIFTNHEGEHVGRMSSVMEEPKTFITESPEIVAIWRKCAKAYAKGSGCKFSVIVFNRGTTIHSQNPPRGAKSLLGVKPRPMDFAALFGDLLIARLDATIDSMETTAKKVEGKAKSVPALMPGKPNKS